MLDKYNEVDYLNGSEKILTKIEDKYAEGQLSPTDRKTLTSQIYREQGKQVDYLKTNEDDGAWWRWGDFTYKDANEFIEENSSVPEQSGRILLNYFRKINDGGAYDNSQKRDILRGLVSQANANELNLPAFASIDEAKAAFEAGKIKKGDRIYINGIRGIV